MQVFECLDDGQIFLLLVVQDETLLKSHASTVDLAFPQRSFADRRIVDEAALAFLPTGAACRVIFAVLSRIGFPWWRGKLNFLAGGHGLRLLVV